MKHVILGVGAAGIAAAEAIRTNSKTDEITIISTDEFVHSRCMLHKYLSHERDEAGLNFTSKNFFSDNNITWLSSETVTSIDTNAKTITLSEQKITYDNLLIATGASSVIPPIGDLKTAKNVFGLRDLSDAQAMDKKLDTSESIVIIGSGLVGLDAAYAFLERGKAVTIVEMADRILPLQLDDKSALAYQKLFEQHGCTFRLSKKASKTICNETGSITHIVLDDGEQLPCDMILVAAGVRPNLAFLEESGIKYERAIDVNPYMQTSCENVYAAGDVTGLSGIWPNAKKQGVVAAKNMCGIKAEYTDTFAIKNTINFYSLPTLSVGKIVPEEGDELLICEDRNTYKKALLRDGRVLGVILQGDINNSGFWQYLIKNKIDIRKLNKPVWKLSFADFYGVQKNGEYEWAI